MKRKKRFSALHFVYVFIVIFCASCSEEIDKGARYTFMGETIRGYLETNEETFSDFLYILDRGGYKHLMGAYGTYTCFAPTNEAIERYLVEQDSIWRASLQPGSKKEIWTGITSPVLTELSDSMCEVLAKTHLMGRKCLTAEMGTDVLPTQNLYHRNVTVKYGVNENFHSIIFVNNAPIQVGDIEEENGVIHVLDGVMSIATLTVPAVIEETTFLTIFSEALNVTGWCDSLNQYKDNNYAYANRRYNDITYGSMPCPAYKYYGYTAFCEPDEVFNKNGIYNLDDLYRQCRKWYPMATDPDFRSRNNALNKFIAYHLLNRKLPYSRLVFYKLTYFHNGTRLLDSELNFPSTYDRTEYYETMQGTLLKATLPLSNNIHGADMDGNDRDLGQCILLNYAKDMVNKGDPFNTTFGSRQIPGNIMVLDPQDIANQPERYTGYSQEALNGSIQLIDHPLIYDEEMMASQVLNEVMRMDIIGFFPELSNNDVRWSSCVDFDYTDQPYFVCAFPPGYCEGIKYNTNETIAGMCQTGSWYENYQGDIIFADGQTDWSIRMPPVPAGTYEIRLCYFINSYRGVCQFYLDDVITGIPIDLRVNGKDPRIGYVADSDTPDNGVTNDKQMKNRGYMKSPNSFYMYEGNSRARTCTAVLRKVLVTRYLSEGEHWMRFKNLSGDLGGLQQLAFDYIELVPVGLLKRTDLPVDFWRQ